jgi:hypothetical protein
MSEFIKCLTMESKSGSCTDLTLPSHVARQVSALITTDIMTVNRN